MPQRKIGLRPAGAGPGANFKMGNAYFEQGKYEEALREFEAVVKKSPSISPAHVRIGDVHLTLKRYDMALAAYQTALRLSPTRAACHVKLGNLYAAQNNPTKPALFYA